MELIRFLAAGVLGAGLLISGTASAGPVARSQTDAIVTAPVVLVGERFDRRVDRRVERRADRRAERRGERREVRDRSRREVRREIRREARRVERRAERRERLFERRERRAERRAERRERLFERRQRVRTYYRGRYDTFHLGDRLPRSALRLVDHRDFFLPRPRRGYGYVRVDNDFLLVALATGVIVDILR